jgi:hypothetical protein
MGTMATAKPTKRYLLRQGTQLAQDAVGDLGETNTGDPKVLEEFLDWGTGTYPAAHYLVVLWNHGAGWDDTNIYRFARRDLRLAVTRRGVTADPAPDSGTGTISSSHLRAVGGHRFRRALFRTTVEQAVRTRAIAFDDGAEDFLDNVEVKRVLTRFRAIIQARAEVQQYDDPPQYVDLGDLCQLIRAGTRKQSIVAACRAVEQELAAGGFVLASGFRGKAVAHSNGVSIYFPPRSLSPL